MTSDSSQGGEECTPIRQLRNQNAIEVAKIFSEDLSHYRSRLTASVTSFAALSLLFAGAVYSYNGVIDTLSAYLLIGVLVALALWTCIILHVNRIRGSYAKKVRKQLLESIDLPLTYVDGQAKFFSFDSPDMNGNANVFGSLAGVTALGWLIVAFVVVLPIAAVLSKAN